MERGRTARLATGSQLRVLADHWDQNRERGEVQALREPDFATIRHWRRPIPKLADAYLAYQPFRDFIKTGGARAPSSAAQVLNVAVITVGRFAIR